MAKGFEDAAASEGAAVEDVLGFVAVELGAVFAGAVGCGEHGGIVAPDAHGEAIVADREGGEDLVGEAAIGLAHPSIGDIDVAAKIDDAVDIEAGAENEAGSGEDHASAAGVFGAGFEDEAGMIAIQVIAFATVHNGEE